MSSKTTVVKSAAPAKKGTLAVAKKGAAVASKPTYFEMVKSALTEIKDKKGCTRPAILKHIGLNHDVGNNVKTINLHLRNALKKGLAEGKFVQVSGPGLNGRFKITQTAMKAPKVIKKPVAKKPATAAASTSKGKSTAPKAGIARGSKPTKISKNIPKKTGAATPKKVAKAPAKSPAAKSKTAATGKQQKTAGKTPPKAIKKGTTAGKKPKA